MQIKNPENYFVRITDTTGKTKIHTKLDASSEIDISSLKDGTYLLLASDGDITISKKFVVKN